VVPYIRFNGEELSRSSAGVIAEDDALFVWIWRRSLSAAGVIEEDDVFVKNAV
jgi:hypothetical protein